MPFFDPIRIGASGAVDDFTVDRSARYNRTDNHHFKKQPSSAGNRRTFTISVWVKKSNQSANGALFYAGTSVGANHNDTDAFLFNGSNQLNFVGEESQTVKYDLVTNRKFRDPSAWYHIVLAVDTTQSTSSNRIKLYINGVQETSFATETYPSQNYELFVNSTVSGGYTSGNIHVLGYTGSGRGLDGYLAEYHLIDGQQLTPASFAETNTTTGQWIPIDTSGLTYGTNGFRLQFSDNSDVTASTLGKDNSGQGNNYTPVNFQTGDAVKDTPTNNFCTLSSVYDAGIAFGSGSSSEAGLRYTGGSSNRSIGSTFGIQQTDTQGYYFEARIISGNQANRLFVGIGYTSTDWISTDARGANDDSWVLRNGDGVFIHNSSVDGETTGAGGLSIGDIIQIAVKGSKIWVGKNGSYFFSGNPSGDSTPKFSDIASTWTPVADVMTSNVVQFNFGQDSSFSNTVTAQGNTDANGNGDFFHSPPTGFLALCSANLPEPTIKLPNKYFDILTWTGNSTNNRSITGLQFQPDFVWIKKRTSSAAQHSLVNSITGTSDNSTGNGNVGDLDSADSGGEAARSAGGFESFDANGFTLGKGSNDANADSAYQLNNASGQTYVAWNWNGGGSTATNNDGSITTQVRASTIAGFSVISYTGGGSAGTIGHGLGVAPQAIITKRRSGIEDWKVFHQDISAAHFLKLNATQAQTNNTNVYPNTAPTSTVYSVGSHDSVTGNGDTYIVFCFSEVAGYSKFGFFKPNGNVEANFVFLGFRPAWVMLKQSTSSDTAHWFIFDSTRNTRNTIGDEALASDLNETEGLSSWNPNTSGSVIDFLSNGFKIRTTSTAGFNVSGQTMVYFAFAEAPFKNARAR